MEVKLVQAWNGKWHVLERVTGLEPAYVPGERRWSSRIPKPARPIVLTGCGLRAFGKKFEDVTEYLPRKRRYCNNCESLVEERLHG